ncbi:MAG: hypothetical protein D3M94_18025 [Rhodocyclales bacterium GT-UBC]|nr:MAG: hypothetical protein D3M94_18025 [Rhodocyclales bacterium GT-UBC]
MELIAEIVVQVLGSLLQFVAELLLQVVLEVLADLLGRSIQAPFSSSRPRPAWLSGVGHLIMGAAAGWATLWLFPAHFIEAEWLRLCNLLLTPLAAGMVMEAIGSWRMRRDKDVFSLEHFVQGFCFAFAMAVVRYLFGH